jgi:hypothetical protein
LGQQPSNPTNDDDKTLAVRKYVEPTDDIGDEIRKTDEGFPKDIVRSVFPILLMGMSFQFS